MGQSIVVNFRKQQRIQRGVGPAGEGVPSKATGVATESKAIAEEPAAVFPRGEVPVPAQQQHLDLRELKYNLKRVPSDCLTATERPEQQ